MIPLAQVSRRDALLKKEEEIPLWCAVLLRLGGPEEPANALTGIRCQFNGSGETPMSMSLHLVTKLKGVHLRKHELGQEILVVFREVGKIRGIPRTHLDVRISKRL